MGKAPAFQFYAADFLTGTMLMSMAEVGLYTRLLCLQAEHGSVPDDVERVVHAFGEQARNLWPSVRGKFFKAECGNLKNEKLCEVLAQRDNYRERQSIKGKKSAEVRFNRGSTAVEPLEDEVEVLKSEKKGREPENVKAAFRAKCAEAVAVLKQPMPDEERAAFFAYWTEANARGHMRFQDQKYFDHKRRMETWMRNAVKRDGFGKPAAPLPSPTLKPWMQ